jgi:hypothetical protein
VPAVRRDIDSWFYEETTEETAARWSPAVVDNLDDSDFA